ncbi:MAG: MFS transporter, partial [Coriobacteriia bacterium]|nr:MFS transporter [Coriobacteriia bacterium]
IGRKASFLLGIAVLFVSTLLYVGASRYSWGVWAFVGASVLIGFGFTCQTGAVDAWLIDALDHVGYDRPREQVFARGGMVFGIAMLVGTLVGGFLGQVDLELPYVVRAVILLVTFAATLSMMHEIGFEPRPLEVSRFGAETRAILDAGTRYGWRSRVVRPLMFVSAAQGLFMMYFFYSSQPYALDLLGRPDLVWVAGVLTALFGLAGVVGNSMVKRVTKASWGRNPARLLAWGAVVAAAGVAALGVLGVLAPEQGSLAAFAVMVGLFAFFGVISGVTGPVRQAFLNEHIPSRQRATVLSLDSFFGDVGGSVGQPGLGLVARTFSIPVGYLIGAAIMGVAYPLYRRAGRAAEES